MGPGKIILCPLVVRHETYQFNQKWFTEGARYTQRSIESLQLLLTR